VGRIESRRSIASGGTNPGAGLSEIRDEE